MTRADVMLVWTVVFWSSVLNFLTLAVLRRETLSNGSPFAFHRALVRNDIAMAALLGTVFTWFSTYDKLNRSRAEVQTDLVLMQGLMPVALGGLGSYFLLLAAMSLDRASSLRSMSFAFYKSAEYRRKANRMVIMCTVMGYALTVGVYYAEMIGTNWDCLESFRSSDLPLEVFEAGTLGLAWLGSLGCGLRLLAAHRKALGQTTRRRKGHLTAVLVAELALSAATVALLALDTLCSEFVNALTAGGREDEVVWHARCKVTEGLSLASLALTLVSNTAFFFCLSSSFRKHLRAILQEKFLRN